MIILSQKYDIIYYHPTIEVDRIYRAFTICYASTKSLTYDEQCDFIAKHFNPNGVRPHTSPIEHSSLSVEFTTNRAIAAELLRHRLISANQESTRYCNYSRDRFAEDSDAVMIAEHPFDFKGGVKFIMDPRFNTDYDNFILDCKACEEAYMRRIKNGHVAEEARGVLNNDVATRVMVTTNFVEWRHIFNLRTAPEAHYQIQSLLRPLKNYLAKDLPCVFGDLAD